MRLLVLGRLAEIGEQHIADRAVHGLRHQQRQQRAGGADHHAGDHQRRVLQHEPFEADREAGEGVVDRDHDRHVRAADRQRHQDAEEQRAAEEQIDQMRAASAGIGALCATKTM
jgi:hypothetical protein